MMTKKLKLLASSFMLAMSLATPQLLHAMEVESMDVEPQRISFSTSLQSFSNYFWTTLGYETPQKIEPLDLQLSKSVPLECWQHILEEIAPKIITLNKHLNNLRLVCKDWCNFINEHEQAWFAFEKPCWKAWYGVLGHENTYNIVKNMVVIYRPNPNSDEGMIPLTIPSNVNPLDYTFDLSDKDLFGDVGDYLSISVGYRKGMNPKNSKKVEIWIAPWFLIKQFLATSAKHFEPIMNKDRWNEANAPVGIIFNEDWWKDMRDYAYLTNQNFEFISKNNCLKLLNHAEAASRTSFRRLVGITVTPGRLRFKKFHFYFEPK